MQPAYLPAIRPGRTESGAVSGHAAGGPPGPPVPGPPVWPVVPGAGAGGRGPVVNEAGAPHMVRGS
ncbi:hypothetical protein, partial [Paenarthrobacter sp. Z7-10]|uniref:hypothetical protein n=1 Tax=Paenarthrobacter sp. Z7-10 TaxID=2787635 RepID=UPI0022A9C0A1